MVKSSPILSEYRGPYMTANFFASAFLKYLHCPNCSCEPVFRQQSEQIIEFLLHLPLIFKRGLYDVLDAFEKLLARGEQAAVEGGGADAQFLRGQFLRIVL